MAVLRNVKIVNFETIAVYNTKKVDSQAQTYIFSSNLDSFVLCSEQKLTKMHGTGNCLKKDQVELFGFEIYSILFKFIINYF